MLNPFTFIYWVSFNFNPKILVPFYNAGAYLNLRDGLRDLGFRKVHGPVYWVCSQICMGLLEVRGQTSSAWGGFSSLIMGDV